MHWAANDTIVYSAGGNLYRVGSSGGEPEVLLETDTLNAFFPHLLPGGRGVVFSTFPGGGPANARILLLETETGDVRALMPSGTDPKYTPTGHLLYGHGDQALMGVSFDLETLQTNGPQIPILPSVTVGFTGQSNYDFTTTGTLIYASIEADDSGEPGDALVWVAMDGNETRLPVSPRPEAPLNPRVAPDGVRVAYESAGHIWIFDTESRNNTQLTFEGRNGSPVWSIDGDYVYFLSERSGTEGMDGFRRVADGSTSAEQLWIAGGEEGLTGMSADGHWLVVGLRTGGGRA